MSEKIEVYDEIDSILHRAIDVDQLIMSETELLGDSMKNGNVDKITSLILLNSELIRKARIALRSAAMKNQKAML